VVSEGLSGFLPGDPEVPQRELEKINRDLINLGRELNIPLVATNDVHYIFREDAPIHELLLCVALIPPSMIPNTSKWMAIIIT